MQGSTASAWYQQQSGSEKSSSSAAPLGEVKEASESDDDIGRVPEMGILAGPSTSVSVKPGNPKNSSCVSQRKRDTAPGEREHTRLKRLLRNRVSAQQARERKKAYLTELETKVKELEQKNSELEERVSTLQNENHMLRQKSRSAVSTQNGSVRSQRSKQIWFTVMIIVEPGQ